MYYPFHPQSMIILNQQFFNWLGLFNLIAVAYIGWQAHLISKRQADLEDYADIFIRAYKSPDTQKWEIQIRNACPRVIYIIDSWFEEEDNKKAFGNLNFSRNEPATLSAGENNYYSLQIRDFSQIARSNNVPTFHLHIRFKDVLNKERESHHAGWFQEGRWVIHNLKSKIV